MYINFITKANDYNTQPHFLTQLFLHKKSIISTLLLSFICFHYIQIYFFRRWSWKVCILFSGGSNTVCEFEVWNVWKGLKSLVLLVKFWFEKFRISICLILGIEFTMSPMSPPPSDKRDPCEWFIYGSSATKWPSLKPRNMAPFY